jgi:hypothetical protein
MQNSNHKQTQSANEKKNQNSRAQKPEVLNGEFRDLQKVAVAIKISIYLLFAGRVTPVSRLVAISMVRL